MKINKPYTTQQYAELAMYCNQNNCIIEDKGDYLESVEIIQSIEELKKEKIIELKQKRDNYKIDNNYYSDNTVLNLLTGLGTYTELERQNFRDFFNDLIEKYDNYKSQINNSSTKEELDNITITFED